MKKVYFLSLFAIAMCAAAYAGKGGASGAKQYRANGEHTCQSYWNLGYKCTAWGDRFYSDKAEAYHALLRKDCCAHAVINGIEQRGAHSIDFRLSWSSPKF